MYKRQVYNAEKYLAECLESIQKQTYTNIEIILVDDGSKDSSPTLCDTLQKEDNRIKVIHKVNEGAGTVSYTHLNGKQYP